MDELTQISTFDDVSPYLQGLGHEGAPPFAVILDFDGLAWLNSYRGHPGGDEALIKIAVRLTEIAETCGGKVFRSGDDEFLLLTHCAANDALSLAKEAMEAIKSLRIPYMRLGEPKGVATVSAIVFPSPRALGSKPDRLQGFIETCFKAEKARGCSKRNLLIDLSAEAISWD